jgi:hypothetical protein
MRPLVLYPHLALLTVFLSLFCLLMIYALVQIFRLHRRNVVRWMVLLIAGTAFVLLTVLAAT